MTALVGRKKIVNSIISGNNIKVLNPACGTGGFLVYLLQDSIEQLNQRLKLREITRETYDNSVRIVKENIFFGSDANEGVAASAKMNMIIAGDGHTNIQNEDSLSISSTNWNINTRDCNLIMTNPPFGTSEGESLTSEDNNQFEIPSGKGQYLFIQKMIKCTRPGGEICTVIDEGVLNTDSGKKLREYILKTCKLICVVNLPNETFKPNKINVKSSLLYLEKRTNINEDLNDNYQTTICQFDSLGYIGSGEKIRNFDKDLFLNEIEANVLDHSLGNSRKGYNWNAFDINIQDIYNDDTFRFDYKYWNVNTRVQIDELKKGNNPSIKDINLIPTSRGKSPSADSYVDEQDGFAIVIKAGSNISKFGKIITTDSDWIEKSIYDEFLEKSNESNSNTNIINKWDVLLSSTGDGTLGKCCVYDLEIPAIADGHVTIIRVDKNKINPYYLADYLRLGFGAVQVSRFYTGSTGLIELTPEQVDRIIIDTQNNDINKQKELSNKIRTLENDYLNKISEAENLLISTKDVL